MDKLYEFLTLKENKMDNGDESSLKQMALDIWYEYEESIAEFIEEHGLNIDISSMKDFHNYNIDDEIVRERTKLESRALNPGEEGHVLEGEAQQIVEEKLNDLKNIYANHLRDIAKKYEELKGNN